MGGVSESPSGTMFDLPHYGMGSWWIRQRSEIIGKISKRAKPQSDQRPTGLKKTFFLI